MRLPQVRRVGGASLSSGVLLRHRALYSEAVYRVLHASGSIVEVKVVAAPGLEPRTRLQFTAAAAAAMRSVAPGSVDRQHLQFGSPARDVRSAA